MLHKRCAAQAVTRGFAYRPRAIARCLVAAGPVLWEGIRGI